MKSSLNLPDTARFESDSIERRIISSVEQLDIDLARSVLVGSAALKLYGVELPGNRPGDVDLTLDASQFIELYEARKTPSGLSLAPMVENRNPKFSILEIPGDQARLPVDAITQFDARTTSQAHYDKKFQAHYQKHAVTLPGASGVRIATPDYLRRTLKAQSGDPKHRADLAAFERAERTARKNR